MPNMSIIIPVFNEEGNVAELHQEIVAVCESQRYKYEVIFVDDGSTDRTGEVIKSIAPIKYVRLRRNFGQTAALDAGIKSAEYDYVVTMDGDRQNDPLDIPRLVRHLEENHLDVVSGWRKNRKDTIMKRFISRGASLLRGLILQDGIHDSGCSLKIYKRECFQGVSLLGEMHRFVPAILKMKGFSIGEIEVNHRARTKGKTKYTWKRAFQGFIDMIALWFWNRFAVRPLHLLGGIGLIVLFAGGCSALMTVLAFLDQKEDLSDTVWPLLTAFLTITGIMLFGLGLISDILSKNYYETSADKSYSIKEVVENQ